MLAVRTQELVNYTTNPDGTRRLISPNGLELNEQQTEFVIWAMEWVYNNIEIPREELGVNSRFRLLTGYPGVGKSTACITLVSLLKLAKLKVCLAAPTHQAKEVLIEMALENDVQVPCKTIYSLLGLRPEISDDGEETFVKDPSVTPSLGEYDFIVYDEASMTNRLLWTILKNTVDCPLVLCMGDIDQLRPVKSDTKSLVFSEIKNQFRLTQIMRFEGAIAQYVADVRNSNYYVNPERYANNLDVVVCNKLEWLTRLADCAERNESFRALAFKNSSVAAVNSVIRTLYYKRKFGYSISADDFELRTGINLPSTGLKVIQKAFGWKFPEIAEYLPGDKLLVKKPVTEWSAAFKGTVTIIPNGAKLTVTRAEEWELEGYACYSLWVEWIETQEDGSKLIKSKLIYVLCEHETDRFNIALNDLKLEALQFPPKSRERSWGFRKYFKLRDVFASVQHHFCSTTHRSQGCTFDTVFVYPDILDCRDLEVQKELNYVACSRAKRQLVICR